MKFLAIVSPPSIYHVILGAINALILLLFDNAFMYWKISIVGDKFSVEMIISC